MGIWNLRGRRLDLIPRPGGEPDFRACLRERAGTSAADTSASAGYEGRAAVESEIHLAGVVSFFAPRPTLCPPYLRRRRSACSLWPQKRSMAQRREQYSPTLTAASGVISWYVHVFRTLPTHKPPV